MREIALWSLLVILGLVILGNLVRNFRKLSTADVIICTGAVAAIVSAFLPWYGWETIRFTLWEISRGTMYIILASGAVALAEVSSRVTFYGDRDGLSDGAALIESIAILAASGLVTLVTIIRLVSVPDIKEGFGAFITIGRSWGLWMGVIAAMIFITGSAMKMMEVSSRTVGDG